MAELKHLPIPIDERLSHLTLDEIDELFNAYHFSEQKATNLLEKYKIEGVALGGLRYVLKIKENQNNSCSIHNVVSWQNAIGRNKWKAPYCPECNEIMWSEYRFKTYTPKKKIEYSSQRKPQNSYYLLDFESYSKLNYLQKVTIVTWFIECIETWPILKISTLDSIKFFPSEVMYANVIESLKESKIFDSENHLKNEMQLDSYLFEQFKSANYYFGEDAIDIFNVWWDIAYNEIAEYFLYELEKKNLPTEFNKEYRATIQYLTKNLPIQQAMFAIWASIKDSCSIIAEKNWDLDYASKVIPVNLKKKADRLIEGSLKYYPFNRPYPCPQSKLSKVFSEIVLELNGKYFTKTPNMTAIIKIQENDFKRRGTI